MSAAYRGLLAAARAFDPGREIKFSSYAVPAIKDQIAKAARDERLIRIPQRTYGLLRHGDRHPSPSPSRRRQTARCIEAASRLLAGHRLDAEWDLVAILDDRPEPDKDLPPARRSCSTGWARPARATGRSSRAGCTTARVAPWAASWA